MPSRTEMLAVLVENRGAFLSFLEKRVGRGGAAEDVLQEAFARILDKVPLGDEESVVALFYRALRNAVVDHYRRSGASARALAALAKERHEPGEPDLHAQDSVCRAAYLPSGRLHP